MKTRIHESNLGRTALFALILALAALFTGPAMADEAPTANCGDVTMALHEAPGETPLAQPAGLFTQDAEAKQGGGFCIQVITYGQNPGTGECQQFATPCDVPNGWCSYSTLEECQTSSC